MKIKMVRELRILVKYAWSKWKKYSNKLRLICLVLIRKDVHCIIHRNNNKMKMMRKARFKLI